MDKREALILGLLFVLTGCHNNLRIACDLDLQDKEVCLDIYAHNDDIEKIDVRESFEIPNYVLADKDKYDFIAKQLDEQSHFEDNKIVKEYSVLLDKTYSLSETLKNLKSRRFYCE